MPAFDLRAALKDAALVAGIVLLLTIGLVGFRTLSGSGEEAACPGVGRRTL